MKTIFLILLFGIFSTFPNTVQAEWPQKPIRIIVAAPAGSSVDIVSRVIADKLKEKLQQPIIIDNKPAAGGTVAAAEVAKAIPDGYTLYMGYNGPLANASALYKNALNKNLPYDPQRDFAPIILTALQPNVLAVNANVSANNLKEFLALVKSQPGKLNYASVGNGSVSHLSMEMLKREAAIDITHVPYNGGPPAVQAVIAGDADSEIQAIFTAPSNVIGQIKAGKLKAIGVTSLKRFTLLPDVATIAESGIASLARFEAISWNALVAPRDTPSIIVTRLNAEINAIFLDAGVKKKFADAGIEVGGGTAESLRAWMKSEAEKWGEIIRVTGARVD
jgi:tripartite-type tricarboxylate transporter receptor subunit TctC